MPSERTLDLPPPSPNGHTPSNQHPLDSGDRALTREFFRLCLCAKRDPNALPAALEIASRPDIDWSSVSSAAAAARVSPLLYQALRGHDTQFPEFFSSLRSAYDYTARRNLLLLNELATILSRFKSNGVNVIVLKGAALAQVVYGNLGLRPLRDVDLLVRRESTDSALSALEELGYISPTVETGPGATLAYESQMMLVKPGPMLTQVEVHWSLIDSPYYQSHLPLDWFWQTAVPWHVGGIPSLMLGPEAQVLYLCAHLLLHHGGDDLLWLNEVAQVVEYYGKELAWDQVLKHASTLGLVIPTRQILTLAARAWAAPIPLQVVEQLEAMSVSREEARTLRWVAVKGEPAAQRLWADLATMPGWRQRLAFGLTNLFPSRAYMQRRYRIAHPLLVLLYYPYRWALGIYNAFASRTRT